MSGKLTKRMVQIERRLTTLESRMTKLDHALREFWTGIPFEQRMELIKEIEIGGSEEVDDAVAEGAGDGVQSTAEDEVGEGTAG